MNSEMMFLIITVVIFTLFLSGCETGHKAEDLKLPTDAVNVRSLGNGWHYFELHGRKFLYHRGDKGHNGYECVTEISRW
jgi:hypothetical protein